MPAAGELWHFCRGLADGRVLTTLKQRRAFALQLNRDGSLLVVPESTSRPQPLRYDEIRALLNRYTETRSEDPGDYADLTRNASYILTLLAIFRRETEPRGTVG